MTMLQLTLDLNQAAQRENFPGATNGINDVISSILSAVFVVAALLVLLYLIWGAIDWISAGGDSSKIQKARDKIIQSIIGVIVLASTLAIFGLLQYILGVDILTFSTSRSSRTAGPSSPTTSAPNNSPTRSGFNDWLESLRGGSSDTGASGLPQTDPNRR